MSQVDFRPEISKESIPSKLKCLTKCAAPEVHLCGPMTLLSHLSSAPKTMPFRSLSPNPKAKGHECKEKFIVSFPAEARSILFPPISTNYFGNCVVPKIVLVETRELREEENGFSMIAKKIGDLILELKASGHEVQKPKPLKKDQFNLGEQFELCSTGSSPKYKSYETDFGWGKPKQIEMIILLF